MRALLLLSLVACLTSCAAQSTKTSKTTIPTDKEAEAIYLRLASVKDIPTMKRVADSLLKADRLVQASYGLPKISTFTGDSLLRARYGILVWRGDCSPATGMNELNGKMTPEIKRRFGDDVLEKTYREGDSLWRAKHP